MSQDTTALNPVPEIVPESGLLTDVHLQRLHPEQIDATWQTLLLPAVQVGLGSAASEPAALEAVWFAVKQDLLRVYAIGGKTPDGPAVAGSIIVGRHKGVIPGDNALHIWSLYANSDLRLADWQSALSGLRAIARELGCSRIAAQTNNPQVVQLVQGLGGQTTALLLQLEV